MNKLKNLFSAPEFKLLIFILSVLAFTLPMFITPNQSNNKFVIYSLYASWPIIILLLYFCAQSED